MLGSNYQRLTKKCSILEMQRMLLWMRGKLVKFQKISVTNINFKGGITTTTSHIPPMTFQTAEVMQKDGNKVKLSCVLNEHCSWLLFLKKMVLLRFRRVTLRVLLHVKTMLTKLLPALLSLFFMKGGLT